MEVTRHNFKSLLPSIEKVISDADFLSIDAEFTGLLNGKRINPFDTPSEYYTGVLESTSDFLLLQFGLCAFRWDKSAGTYKYHAYNFYVFPWGRGLSNGSFLCELSSIDFLAKQGLDFNKVFREGISYITVPVEKKLREQLEERQKLYNVSDSYDEVPIPDDSSEYIKDICSRVGDFLDANEPENLVLDRCNAFQRKLCFQELRKKYSGRIYLESKVDNDGNRVVSVSRCTEAEMAERQEEKKQKEWAELEESVGFSNVMKFISQSGKLVIGHNMLLDVMHTLNHFFAPLPTDYAEFKQFAHCMFPTLLDTKYMCSLPPFKDRVPSSVLAHLLATVADKPFGIPPLEGECPECSYGLDANKQHEAAFDALITGRCFLALYGYLQSEERPRADLPRLRPYTNKLYLSCTAPHESPCINLSGKDLTPSRDHVFHLTFPKEWNRNNIVQLFSPFGHIYISFLNETSALIALMKRENAVNVQRNIKSGNKYTITTFRTYKASLESNKKTISTVDHLHWSAPKQATPSSETPPTVQLPSRKRKHGDADSGDTKKAEEDSLNSVMETIDIEEDGCQRARSYSASSGGGVRKRRTSSGTFSVEELEATTHQGQSRPVEKAGNSRKSRVRSGQPWKMGQVLENVRKQKQEVDLGQVVKRDEVPRTTTVNIPSPKKKFVENENWE